jgi:hypothetical protein
VQARIPVLVMALALALATVSCGSDQVDRLATDTCEVLTAYQAGDVSLTEVQAEFRRITDRAEEAGASLDGIEAQVQVQCPDSLEVYLIAVGAAG